MADKFDDLFVSNEASKSSFPEPLGSPFDWMKEDQYKYRYEEPMATEEIPFLQRAKLGLKGSDANKIAALEKEVGKENVHPVVIDGTLVNIKIRDPITGKWYLKNDPTKTTVSDVAENLAGPVIENIIPIGAAIATQGASIPLQMGAQALASGAGTAIKKGIEFLTPGGSSETAGEVGTDIGLSSALGGASELVSAGYRGAKYLGGKAYDWGHSIVRPVTNTLKKAEKDIISTTGGIEKKLGDVISENEAKQAKVNELINKYGEGYTENLNLNTAQLSQSETLQKAVDTNLINKETAKNMVALDSAIDSYMNKLKGTTKDIDPEKLVEGLEDVYKNKYIKGLKDKTRKVASVFAERYKSIAGDDPVFELNNFEKVLKELESSPIVATPSGVDIKKSYADQQRKMINNAYKSNEQLQIAKEITGAPKTTSSTIEGADLLYPSTGEMVSKPPTTKKINIDQLQYMMHLYGAASPMENELLRYTPSEGKQMIMRLRNALYQDLDESIKKGIPGSKELENFRDVYSYLKKAEEEGHSYILDKFARQEGFSDFASLGQKLISPNISDRTIRKAIRIAHRFGPPGMSTQIQQQGLNHILNITKRVSPKFHTSKLSFYNADDIVGAEVKYGSRIRNLLNTDRALYDEWKDLVHLARLQSSTYPKEASQMPAIFTSYRAASLLPPAANPVALGGAVVAMASSKSKDPRFIKAMSDPKTRKKLIESAKKDGKILGTILDYSEWMTKIALRLGLTELKNEQLYQKNYVEKNEEKPKDKFDELF